MRVLVATTAGAGHFGPLIPFARACADAAHEVRVAAPASFRHSVEAAGFVHEPFDDADPAALGAVFGRLGSLPLEEGDRHVVQDVFGRLDARAALPGLRDVVARWRPDLMLREPAELASHVVADEAGIPQVRVAIGLDRQDDLLLPLLEEPLAELGCRSGVAGMAATPRWTLVPPSFDVAGELVREPPRRFREPLAAPAPLPAWWDPNAWWDADDNRPLVYCTFGSVAAALPLYPGFYRRIVDALAAVPVRALLTIGAGADPAELGSLPTSIHVERFWPQHDVLPHADLLVGHGGFGTTLAALTTGVPQIAIPLFSFDQFQHAERVAETGVGTALLDDPSTRPVAGVVMQHGPEAADGLADAVQRVLADDAYRRRAAQIAAEVTTLTPVSDCLSTLADLVPDARSGRPSTARSPAGTSGGSATRAASRSDPGT